MAARVINVGAGAGGGVQCCCCSCCTCINVRYLGSREGFIKIAQVCLGLLSQSLLMHYGRAYAASIGPAYDSAVSATASCLLTAGLLLATYTFSTSKAPVAGSIFEPLFNTVAALLHASAAGSLSWATNTYLWPQYLISPFYQVFPAMVAAYSVGVVLAILHGVDAYTGWKRYSGYA